MWPLLDHPWFDIAWHAIHTQYGSLKKPKLSFSMQYVISHKRATILSHCCQIARISTMPSSPSNALLGLQPLHMCLIPSCCSKLNQCSLYLTPERPSGSSSTAPYLFYTVNAQFEEVRWKPDFEILAVRIAFLCT